LQGEQEPAEPIQGKITHVSHAACSSLEGFADFAVLFDGLTCVRSVRLLRLLFHPGLHHFCTLQRKKTKLSELLGEMEAWGLKVADEDVRKFLREGAAPWPEMSTSGS